MLVAVEFSSSCLLECFEVGRKSVFLPCCRLSSSVKMCPPVYILQDFDYSKVHLIEVIERALAMNNGEEDERNEAVRGAENVASETNTVERTVPEPPEQAPIFVFVSFVGQQSDRDTTNDAEEHETSDPSEKSDDERYDWDLTLSEVSEVMQNEIIEELIKIFNLESVGENNNISDEENKENIDPVLQQTNRESEN